MGNKELNIPVVLFIFRRYASLESIIGRIRIVKPSRLYLIADGPRNIQEEAETEKCREEALRLIDWDCEVIKNFAKENRGVFCNIGLGAKWVFEREEKAIFLEDDNLPETSFFFFCKELLEKYKRSENILWICGTNYLGKYDTNVSYMFTQHLLPCGWASWSDKFLKYYDGYLETINNKEKLDCFRDTYTNKALYKQQLYSVRQTKYFLQTNQKRSSWDYQMLYSVRANNLYGISPCVNQIKNIGVDNYSAHGGNSMKIVMTQRFCGMDSYELDFPLTHPTEINVDLQYEHKIGSIILAPFRDRLKGKIGRVLKYFLKLDPYDSLNVYIKEKMKDGKR